MSAASDDSTVPMEPASKLPVSVDGTIVLSFEDSVLVFKTQSGLAGRLAIADATVGGAVLGDEVAGCPLDSLRVFLAL